MENENKDIFSEVENNDNVENLENVENIPLPPASTPTPEKAEDEITFGDVTDAVSHDIELKPEDEGKEFVIESARILKPRIKDVDGNIIPAVVSKSGKAKYYKSKLEVLFKNCNYKALVSTVMWFENEKEGKKVLNPSFKTVIEEEDLDDNFTGDTSKLYYRYCMKQKIEVGSIGIKSFIDNLPGMKVKLVTKRGKFNGSAWAKVLVKEFL